MSDQGRVFWPGFPIGGWGIGLAAHGLAVWASVSSLRDRLVARELERMQR